MNVRGSRIRISESEEFGKLLQVVINKLFNLIGEFGELHIEKHIPHIRREM